MRSPLAENMLVNQAEHRPLGRKQEGNLPDFMISATDPPCAGSPSQGSANPHAQRPERADANHYADCPSDFFSKQTEEDTRLSKALEARLRIAAGVPVPAAESVSFLCIGRLFHPLLRPAGAGRVCRVLVRSRILAGALWHERNSKDAAQHWLWYRA
jgi:hypothetical protein